MRLAVGILILLAVVLLADCQKKNSKFKWKRPNYAMPWAEGKNVCAVEEVYGSRKKYYSECMTYLPRKICGKNTFIRYHCCTGYERTDSLAKGCEGVVPMEDLWTTARNLYIKDFRKNLKSAGMERVLKEGSPEGVLTVFAPENKAFNGLDQETEFRLSTGNADENLLRLHMTKGRYFLKDMYNDQALPSLLPDTESTDPDDETPDSEIHINRYSNGIVTANCARIILPNQVATNGILHVTEKVVTPAEELGSVMDLLLADGRFEELVTGLIVTGLANELRDKGHYTIIAPTDDAFRGAPEGVLERVLNDKDTLKKLLQYHVMDTSYCSAAILGPTMLRTIEGQKMNLSCNENDQLTVNGVPTIQTDMVATNGVVHALDDILIPDSAKSLGEKLSDLGLLQFMEYMQSAGLQEILDGKADGNYTLFAPNQEAFNALPKGQKRILQTQKNAVKDIFNYHVVPGKYTTKDLEGDANLQVAGDLSASIHVNVYQKSFGINSANIISADHSASGGVIHIIDKVMFPPEKTVHDKINEEEELSQFLNLLSESGLDRRLLNMNSNMTVFAPTNDAFDQLESDFVEHLMEDEEDREKFLKYHLLEKPIYTTGVRHGLQYRFRTTAKEWIRLEQTEKNDPVRINDDALILNPDIETTNGVMHVIDTVLKCPCIAGLENEVLLR